MWKASHNLNLPLPATFKTCTLFCGICARCMKLLDSVQLVRAHVACLVDNIKMTAAKYVLMIIFPQISRTSSWRRRATRFCRWSLAGKDQRAEWRASIAAQFLEYSNVVLVRLHIRVSWNFELEARGMVVPKIGFNCLDIRGENKGELMSRTRATLIIEREPHTKGRSIYQQKLPFGGECYWEMNTADIGFW